jgi:hypothetical protein
MQFVKPITFAEAEAALGARHPVTSTLNSAQWGDVPEGLRTRALFSSEVENVRFLQRAHDMLGDFLSGARENTPGGSALKAGGRAQFVDLMAKFAEAEGMGPLDPRQAGTIKDVRSQRRLELIFDTNVQQAQDFGYWKQGQDPDILDAFPAQRFIRVRTVAAPRKYHEAAIGTVRLKSDRDFWISLNPDFGLPYGPWGFGSGCDVEDVDRDEAESLGLITPDATPQPVEKEFNDALEASTRGISAPFLAHFEDVFGAQVSIDGDRIRWKTNQQSPHGIPYDNAHTQSRHAEDQQRIADARGYGTRAVDVLRAVVPEDGDAALAEEAGRTAASLGGSAAQIGAAAAGLKPLYFDPWGAEASDIMAVGLRHLLPREVEVMSRNGMLFVWRPEVLRPLLEVHRRADESDEDTIVRMSSADANGTLLGYGSAHSPFLPGAVPVNIHDADGYVLAGFRGQPGDVEAVARRRALDIAAATGRTVYFTIQ